MGGGAAAGYFSGALACSWTYASMSRLMTRPPGPVPAT